MVRLFTLSVFLALVATSEAAVCKPRPKPSGSTAPQLSASAVSSGAQSSSVAPAVSSSVSSASAASSGAASAIPPPAVEQSSAAESSAAASAPASTPSATAPPGVDKSKPWNPQDPTNAANITVAATADDISGNSAISKWVLQFHNEFRAQFGTAPVTWDASLAQTEADHTKSCEWKHQGGDNLAMVAMSGTGVNTPATNLMTGWADEWKDSYGPDGKATALNHFTEMVWKDVKSIGCSWNIDCKGEFWNGYEHNIYFTCKYSPAGNFVGQQAEQVGAFIGGQ